MDIVYRDSLNETEERAVWELLKISDHEFIPALSTRNSTSQTKLAPTETTTTGIPVSYFNELKKQSFLLAIEDQTVIGFLSYIHNFQLTLPSENIQAQTEYVSTILVNPQWRKSGAARKMYEFLINRTREGSISTRTWSTNHAHLHLLGQLGFSLICQIKDDRGKGIDTVYYQKLQKIKENLQWERNYPFGEK